MTACPSVHEPACQQIFQSPKFEGTGLNIPQHRTEQAKNRQATYVEALSAARRPLRGCRCIRAAICAPPRATGGRIRKYTFLYSRKAPPFDKRSSLLPNTSIRIACSHAINLRPRCLYQWVKPVGHQCHQLEAPNQLCRRRFARNNLIHQTTK